MTELWGVKVERVQIKNIEITESMQRVIAQEAETMRREKRERQAAETIMQSPAGLELRCMQMITEVGAEQSTMTIIMMPSEFVEAARSLAGRGGAGRQS